MFRVGAPAPILSSMTSPNYSPGSFARATVLVGSAKPQPPRFVLRARHVVAGIGFVLVLVGLYLCGYEPAYQGTLIVRTPKPLVLAQGDSGMIGTGTGAAAVDRLLETGVDGIGLVGQLNENNQLLVFAGAHRLGTLEEVVRAVKGRGLLLVDLREGVPESSGIERRAVEIIRRFDAHLSVVLGSYDPGVLYRIKRLEPLVRTAFIFSDREVEQSAGQTWLLRQEFVRRAIRKFVPCDMLSIDYRTDDSEADQLIAKGWPAFIWGPTSEAEIRRALSRHPYGVISGQAALARGLRGD
jgi:hypothetical protein